MNRTPSSADSSPKALLHGLDWSTTSLGAPHTWPAEYRIAIELVMDSPVPMILLWGTEGLVLYNDSFVPVAGARHPKLFGQPIQVGWPEVADFTLAAAAICWRGESCSFRDQQIKVDRDGLSEDVWLDLAYSPVRDSRSAVVAVLAVVVDVTARVLAQRQLACDIAGRQRAERDRDQTSKLLNAFVEAVPGVVYAKDRAGRMMLANRGTAELVGRPREDLIGKTDAEFLSDPAEAAAIMQTDQRIMANGQAELLEESVSLADGRPAIWLSTKAPFRDDTGTVVGLIGASIDITEQVHAREVLARSHEQLEQEVKRRTADRNRMWQLSGDIMLLATFEGVITATNPAWESVLGWSEAELKGLDLFSLVHPEDLDRTAEAAKLVAEGRTLTEFENRYRTKQGDYRSMSWSARAGEGLIVAVGRDVTTERALAADRERLWMLSPVLKVVANSKGLIAAVNPAWTYTLGWTAKDSMGRRAARFMSRQERRNLLDRVSQMREGASLLQHHVAFVTKAGEVRQIAWTIVRADNAFYGFGRDVTAELEAAEALRLTEEQLRQSQKMEAVGQLTGGLAHDFNNLLAGVSGSLEMMQVRITQARYDELARYLNAAQGAARRAAALTHRLLAFSRRQTLDPKPLNANRLVAELEELIRRTAGPTIELEVVGAGGLWPIFADANQLENAILNLCINARDAMPTGGRITIETANKWLDDRAARERDVPPGQYVSLCVTDTGTGMTPEVVSRAFDPFFTTKPLGEGTGLGLSMIHGFVRQSGGQVRIYTELGKGTTMCMYFPRHMGQGELAEAVSVTPHVPQPNAGQLVLVVDDEPTVRMLISDVLRESGHTILEAEDGASGLRVLQSASPIDLLITDVGLPGGLNGRQLADAARSLRPKLKILFITGYAENAVIGNGHLEPGMAILTKPFAMDTLAGKIRDMMLG